MKKVNIEQSWFNLLEDEFEKPYFTSIRKFLRTEYKNKKIYPHPSNIFNASLLIIMLSPLPQSQLRMT